MINVSHYKTVRRLGESDLAETVLARSTQAGHEAELIVVKRLLPHLMEDEEFVETFVSQARRAQSLEHPHIVDVLDVFEQDKSLLLCTRFYPGVTLAEVIKGLQEDRCTLPIAAAVRMVADVAEGLAHIHETGKKTEETLLHYDLNPDKIIVGFSGVTKLRDVGTAIADAEHLYCRPTTLKVRMAYMPPEQLLHGQLDARGELFALGVIAWELLTGQSLFPGNSQAEVQQAVVEREPTKLRALNPSISQQLDQLVADTLNKDKRARPASVRAFRESLEPILTTLGSGATHTTVRTWMRTYFGDHAAAPLATTDAATEPPATEPPAPDEQVVTAVRPPPPTDLGVAAQAPGHSSVVDDDSIVAHPEAAAGDVEATVDQPRSNRTRRSALPLIALLIALVLAGVAIAALWRAKMRADAPIAATEAPQAPTTKAVRAPESPPQQAALIVHIEPAGARLTVDGKEQSESVGSEGLRMAFAPQTRVRLLASKDGFTPYATAVETPSKGISHVHIRLSPVLQRRPEQGTEAVTASAAVQAVKPSKRPSVPVTRPTHRPHRRHRSQAQRPAVAPTGTLVVAFAPPRAQLTVDGVPRPGLSPIRVSDLPVGMHTIRLAAAGYKHTQRTVEVQRGTSSTVSVNMQPAVAHFDVVSVPDGASVRVDGQPKGRTPLTGLRLRAAVRHTIKIVASGHRPWSTTLTPNEGQNPTVIATLKAVPRRPKPVARASKPVERDVAVARSVSGDARRGASLFASRCKACHGRSAHRVSPRRYTSEQWSRYFATRRHASKVPLRPTINGAQLADVKAYLMSRAADVESPTAAGVR